MTLNSGVSEDYRVTLYYMYVFQLYGGLMQWMLAAYLEEDPVANGAYAFIGIFIAIVYLLIERGMARYAGYPGPPTCGETAEARRSKKNTPMIVQAE